MTQSVTENIWGSELKVFSGGAPQDVLEHLKPQFEVEFAHRIVHSFEHVHVVEKWLTEGREADVVLLPRPLMDRVATTVGWIPGSRMTLGSVGVGVIVPEGSEVPDISSVDNFRRVLLAAASIAVPKADGITGSHLMKVISTLGIADQVSSRLIHKGAIYGAGRLVATGEAKIGLYLASEIKNVPGTKLVGLLPDTLQNYVVYEIGVPLNNLAPKLADAYSKFLKEQRNASVWSDAGFQISADSV